jgi:rod shape-determining protein MreC
MRRRGSLWIVFFICVLLCLVLISLSQKHLLQGVTGLLEDITLPFQRVTHSIAAGSPSEISKLREENAALSAQLAKERDIMKEDQALHDQFATTSLPSKSLLPASIIGSPSFLPGFSKIDSLVIAVGLADGVKVGSAVVYKDNLVGKVVQVMPHESLVDLVSASTMSLAAVTSRTQALGVLRGEGGDGMVLGNVVLSDKLEKGDLVETKGDLDMHGGGYPAGLVVGKILAISKKSSALFQTADVASLLDFEKLSVVFVLRQ